jgi:hypothetical protein
MIYWTSNDSIALDLPRRERALSLQHSAQPGKSTENPYWLATQKIHAKNKRKFISNLFWWKCDIGERTQISGRSVSCVTAKHGSDVICRCKPLLNHAKTENDPFSWTGRWIMPVQILQLKPTEMNNGLRGSGWLLLYSNPWVLHAIRIPADLSNPSSVVGPEPNRTDRSWESEPGT